MLKGRICITQEKFRRFIGGRADHDAYADRGVDQFVFDLEGTR